RPIRCVSRIGWKSADCSGTLLTWFGSSCSRCYTSCNYFMDDKHAHDIKKHLKVYIGVFVALLVGTIITVAVSRVNLGHAGNISLALVIAVLKAALVAGFFMHLVSEKKPIYLIIVINEFFII